MHKLRFWQPLALVFRLSLRLLPLPQSKVGLILLYLRMSLHLLLRCPLLRLPPMLPPWPLRLASVIFLRWPRHLFCVSRSWSAPALRQFLRNFWARSWPKNCSIERAAFRELSVRVRASIAVRWRLLLTSTPKKLKRCVGDITIWLEAFSVYCLILSSHFPHHCKDLLQYRLLILSTHLQFPGRLWLARDRAFRERAAAATRTDGSTINVQLFNFHAAAFWRWTFRCVNWARLIICKFWNRVHCVAPSSSCRFAHKSSSCFGPHRVGAYPGEPPSQSRPSSKRPVDAYPPRSSSKFRP